MGTITVRLTNDEIVLLKNYAKTKKLNVSELIRQTIFERIEDEIDLEAYNRAIAEYRENPVTYTLEEMEKELDL